MMAEHNMDAERRYFPNGPVSDMILAEMLEERDALIADLLAACEEAESALDERIQGASEAFPQWAALLVEAHAGLRAAIAKAKGEDQ